MTKQRKGKWFLVTEAQPPYDTPSFISLFDVEGYSNHRMAVNKAILVNEEAQKFNISLKCVVLSRRCCELSGLIKKRIKYVSTKSSAYL